MLFIRLFTVAIASVCLLSLANAENSPIQQQELQSIDRQMKDLKARLEQDEIREFNEEITTQKQMVADWEEYGKTVQSIKQLEEEEKQLLEQIKLLEQRKKDLQSSLPQH